MVQIVEPRHPVSLSDYESVADLGATVRGLRQEAESRLAGLDGRRMVMVNSTAQGGGVAEMLPPLLTILRELGVDTRWLVIETQDHAFFRLTKTLHNLIHGAGDPNLGALDQAVYDRVSAENAAAIEDFLNPGDVLVVHDPQPMGAGALLRERMDIAAIWRCHIGLDRETAETRAAWAFLDPYLKPYDHAVFTAPEYIPSVLAGRATIIHPAIDPLSHKNRHLQVHDLVGILANSALIKPWGPVITPAYPEPAKRLQADGDWAPATEPEDFGLLFRPIVTQVSRWDRLKGFLPLIEGFVLLKRRIEARTDLDEHHLRALQLVRLVLAGPDPASVDDDPEGKEVLSELCGAYTSLPPHLQADIALLSLPMSSKANNALIVNALQCCSDIVVQNSIQEGFGLTVTEPMWKRAAVMGSSAVGIKQQVRPDLDGLLIKNPEDPGEVADGLDQLLRDATKRAALGRSARQRVHDNFLVFSQVKSWLELLTNTVTARWPNHS
ncbi:glycosyl transferase family 1 [Methyloceanibacter methanicus]|uniref:Glycosyl transferase family 1 n=1 Tax=Methyloceanibacter methanicus TaxID=1774968 RepID=A0A1E3W4M9_9HYPH|nr:glycosyltransferase [Methyloceanibacter methanicus]ODS00751.1 glycosyl transferase family 1 [Methyloceanibacter methanicus]